MGEESYRTIILRLEGALIMIIQLWRGFNEKNNVTIIDDIYIIKLELDIIADNLEDSDDKNVIKTFISGAAEVIKNEGRDGFRKISYEYIVALHGGLSMFREKLANRRILPSREDQYWNPPY